MQVSQFHLFFFHRELHVLCVLSPLDYLRTLYISHVRNIFKDFADLARLEKRCLRSWKYTEKQDIWENYTKFSLTRGKS